MKSKQPTLQQPLPSGTIPTVVPIIAAVLAAAVVFIHLTGKVWTLSGEEALKSLAFAVILFISAGGFGMALLKRFVPNDSPHGLVVVSAIGLGLWMLSTAMLVVGTFIPGSLIEIVWWPVIFLGIFLGCWQGREAIKSFRWPSRVSRWSLVWIVFGVAGAIWLAGALRPPGFICYGDVYDVLEYHLQVPREFYLAGQIGQLQHNAYSYFPMGLEMLYLLAMCLLGGAYEGMYLAQILHGAFGCLAVAALLFSFKSDDRDRIRGRFASAMLASTPAILYLSWLAFVELSMVCYLTLGVLWLRVWLRDKSLRSALCVGIMLGAACAMKYISIGIIAGPVLVMMLLASVRSKKRFLSLLLAGLAILIIFSPWLIRNCAYTGNPVFPLATGTLGRAHWSPESQQRWQDGHGPENCPPVPQPAGWQDTNKNRPTRLQMLVKNFLTEDLFGKALMVVAAGAVIALLIRPNLRGKAWDFTLLGIVIIQALVWYLLAHDMPWRFMVSALVPVILLSAGGLARLADPMKPLNPFKKFSATSEYAKMNWGLAPAMGIFVAIIVLNLSSDVQLYSRETRNQRSIPPWPGLDIATHVDPYGAVAKLGPTAKVMLVGDATAFYYPSGTIYATTFDNHPLDELARLSISDAELIARLREMGVTHILVNWPELVRLSKTYGYPASLSDGLLIRQQKGQKPSLALLERLVSAGMREKQIGFTHQGGERPARKNSWPSYTIYALP